MVALFTDSPWADEAGRPLQETTVDGARPFTKAEMERIRNAPYKLPPSR